MWRVDADGLAGLVVDEGDAGVLEDRGHAVDHGVARLARAADDVLGRDAVGLFGEGAHEVDAAARDDVGLEILVPQVGQQFEHRLIGHVVVGQTRHRVARGLEPGRHLRLEGVDRQAGVRGHDDLEKRRLAARERGLEVPLGRRLQCVGGQDRRIRRRHRPEPVEREEELEVDGLLGPEGAVVVEDRHAVVRRDVAGRGRVGDLLDEGDDLGLGGGVVPRRQRVGEGRHHREKRNGKRAGKGR